MAKKFIDVEKLIESKNPTLLKWFPGFMLNYIKKILHQDEFNTIIEENHDLNGFDFCTDVIKRFNIKVEVEGIENLPKNGRIVLAGNHPCGGLEALALITVLYPVRPDIKFIVNDLLMNMHNLSEFFVGVNKHGANSSNSLKMVNEAFSVDSALFVFPAGLVSRRTNGVVEDGVWKKTVITRSKKHKSPVVPVLIDAPNLSSFFYNLSNIRKNLGIKANVEMFYLANEMAKQKNSTFRIIFGKPIVSDHFDKSKTDKQWASYLKEEVYNLKK